MDCITSSYTQLLLAPPEAETTLPLAIHTDLTTPSHQHTALKKETRLSTPCAFLVLQDGLAAGPQGSDHAGAIGHGGFGLQE